MSTKNIRIKQFPLDFKPRTEFGRADFMVANCNADALHIIELWPHWAFFALSLYGPNGCGKTHLAHVFADHVSACCPRPIPVLIIPANAVNNRNVERIHRENPCLVVEDLTPSANNEALFHLFNLYQNEGGYILFTSEVAPARMHFKLPDLQSRLNIVPSVAIGEPDDEMLMALIVKLFNDRQIIISQEVLSYIMQNIERSFSYAQKLVAEIDNISLAYKRAVSIPIVKEAMLSLQQSDTQPTLF